MLFSRIVPGVARAASRRLMSSDAGAVQKLPKPQLRGYLDAYIKKHIVLGFVFATACASTQWYFVARQRKINYEEFYKTYDAQKDYERMKKAGLFQSVDADS